VTVSVRKTRPPVPCDLHSAGVTIRRVLANQSTATAGAGGPGAAAGSPRTHRPQP
jgi:hypothetical protein